MFTCRESVIKDFQWEKVCAWLLRMSVHVLNGNHAVPAAPSHWQRAPPGYSFHSMIDCTLWYLHSADMWAMPSHGPWERQLSFSTALFISYSYAEQPTVPLQHPLLWLHAQRTAFRSFCAFKNTFQFCTRETLKIANADLRPGVGFDVICASYVTQMCWSPTEAVPSMDLWTALSLNGVSTSPTHAASFLSSVCITSSCWCSLRSNIWNYSFFIAATSNCLGLAFYYSSYPLVPQSSRSTGRYPCGFWSLRNQDCLYQWADNCPVGALSFR